MVLISPETSNWWLVGSIRRSIVSGRTCPGQIYSPVGGILKIKDDYGTARISAFKWKLVQDVLEVKRAYRLTWLQINETESDGSVSGPLKGSPCFYAKFSIIHDGLTKVALCLAVTHLSFSFCEVVICIA
jgi:hypothetical protein